MENIDSLLSQVKIDGTINAKDFVTSLLFSEKDDTKLKNLRSDFKTKFLDPFVKELKNIKSEDIKKMLDPLGISEISEDLKDDFEKYQKQIKEFLKIEIPKKDKAADQNNRLNNTNVESVIPQNVRDNIAQTETQNISEQGAFGPKVTTIEFADDSKAFLTDLIDRTQKEALEREAASGKMFKKYFEDTLKNQKELIDATGSDGFLGMLGKLLAVGGIATVLVSAFWEDHIKPWLEEKFNIDLDGVFQKFEGTIEAIGKFFTMGGLKITFGPLLSIVGNTLKSFGQLIEDGLTWVFKGLFGGAGDDLAKGGAEAAAKSGIFKNFLPKLAGGLFKGVGQTVLKGIPVIGSLLSFYFAYDRFQKSDYIGAVIDVVGGLANLLSFTPLAPLAIPLSLGAAALNAFLDYKSAGTPDTNQAKLGFLGDMAVGLYNMLKKIPLIGGIITSTEGMWKFFSNIITGNWAGAKEGLELMTEFPLFGVFPSILLAFLDATESNPQTGGFSFNLTGFMDKLKTRVGKSVLGWLSFLPNSWLQTIADAMGVPFEGGGTEEDGPTVQETRQKALERARQIPEGTEYKEEIYDKLNEQRKDSYARVREASSEMNESDTFWGKISGQHQETQQKFEMLSDNLDIITAKTEAYGKLNPLKQETWTRDDEVREMAKSLRDGLNDLQKTHEKIDAPKKVDDFIMEPKAVSPLIIDRSNNKAYEPSTNDEITASKKGGIFDKSLEELKLIMSEVNKGILSLNSNISNIQPSIINNNNTSVMGSGDEKNSIAKAMYDVNTDKRSDWWRISREYASTI
jgi:hypothetical protein